MKMRRLSAFFAIILACSLLGGCFLFEAREVPTEPMPTDDAFETYYALITQDDLVLRKEPKTTAEILGTVKAGDQLLVQQITTVDGIEWASTDRGWILAQYVRLRADTPLEEDTNATVVFDSAMVYSTAVPNDATIGALQVGDRVKITQISHYGADVMAYVQLGWVKLSKLLFDGCTVSGMIPGAVNIGCANVRNGPSTNYDIVGNVYRDDEFNFKGFYNSVLNGKPWGWMEDGRWLFVEYITFADGITYVKGDNANYVVPPKGGNSGSGNGNGGSGNGGSGNGGGQTKPVNSPIVGVWLEYDKQHFQKTGRVKCDRIILESDGTFLTSEGNDFDVYYYGTGEFMAAQGGSGEGGTFSVNGSTLTLQYEYLWYAGEQEKYETVKKYTYTFNVSGDFLTFDGNTWVSDQRCEDGIEILYEFMDEGTSKFVKADYVGSWTCSTGETLTLNPDGTFTEKAPDGNTYTGIYMIHSGYGDEIWMYRKTKNGGANQSMFAIGISSTGDQLTLKPDEFSEYPTYVYTRAQ